MQALILALLATAAWADLLEDTVLLAIETARLNLAEREKEAPIVVGTIMETQKANGESELEQLKGDFLSEVTKIVVEKLGVEVLDELSEVDIDSLLKETSPARRKRQTSGCGTTDCTSPSSNSFRTITGKCNNVKNPMQGAAVTPVRRLLGKASYADGFNRIRTKGAKGTVLPSTREISNKIHQEGAKPAFDYSRNHFYMQFGQWIAHDIIFMPSSVGPLGKTLDCSSCDSPSLSENCAPIPVPDDDPYFKSTSTRRRRRRQDRRGSRDSSHHDDRNSKENKSDGGKKSESGTSRCLRLTRALNAQKGLGVRTQINQNTHFLDLSAVYGSEECEGASVRSFVDGKLSTYSNNGDILPPQKKNDSNCLSKAPQYCFTTGDFRNSLHPGLVPLHGLYIKEHNRIAALFKRSNPSWTDEQIFQEARRVNIAQYQHQVYSEYLPLVVGDKLYNNFGLKPLKSGFFTGYSSSVNAALSAEFAAAAFRFGHGLARKDFPRVTNSNRTAGSTVDLGSNIFYVDSHYAANQGGQASFIEGMMHQPGMKPDNEFSFPIRNQLFEIRGQPGSGVDLVAVNIMRGRDIGLFPYNEYRSLVGLKKASSFDDLRNEMDSSNVEALKRVYADVNDIDLYTGIILERPTPGAAIGPTGGYMIAEQFSALKKGDRFYYENQVASTRGLKTEELDAVRRTRLSKVVCMNTAGMETVGEEVFSLMSERVPCSSIPEIDIRPFTSSPPPPPPPSPRRN